MHTMQNESWKVVDDGNAGQPDVQRVEVLKGVDWWHLHRKVMSSHNDVDVRSRLVLQACPYLQHLDLTINPYLPPSHEATFALVPHLRSLRLSQAGSREGDHGRLMFDFHAMLASLPHLTSLHCTSFRRLSVVDLLQFACHSTLEELHIDSNAVLMSDGSSDWLWLGYNMKFPISVEVDERELERHASYRKLRGDIEQKSEAVEADVVDDASDNSPEFTGTGEEASVLERFEEEMQRMRAALTRTQSIERNCRVRLALADWLHRRLRRGGLPTDDHFRTRPRHPKSLLRRYRKQVALLRSTLQRQLSELTVSTVTADYQQLHRMPGPSRRS